MELTNYTPQSQSMQEDKKIRSKLEEEIKNSSDALGGFLALSKSNQIDASKAFPKIIKWIPLQILLYFVCNIYLQDSSYFYIGYSIILILFFEQLWKLGSIYRLIGYFLFIRTTDIAERFREQELELELKNTENQEQRNIIMTRKHYFHLEKYYRQSLAQNQHIFLFGIFIALLGITSIPFIIYLKVDNSVTLSIIQAILTSFVLVIFQVMYSNTNKSANAFYDGLLSTYKNHNNDKS
jgi:hypothetical protein